MIITIDGPAGSGKTTIAKELAKKLGYLYFDTGALYRSLTYFFLSRKIDLSNKNKMLENLPNFKYEIKREGDRVRYFVCDEDVTESIRKTEITENVSIVAAVKEIREEMTQIIRAFNAQDAIFEGRDMGSVVFPKADLKIFLSARSCVRAERRYLEIKDDKLTQLEVEKLILARDDKDSKREVAPLIQPEGSHLIDTSDLSIEGVIEKIMNLIQK